MKKANERENPSGQTTRDKFGSTRVEEMNEAFLGCEFIEKNVEAILQSLNDEVHLPPINFHGV
jgi:hypothetical protein